MFVQFLYEVFNEINVEKPKEGKQAHDKEDCSFNYDFSPIAHIRTQKPILQWQIDRDKANKVVSTAASSSCYNNR